VDTSDISAIVPKISMPFQGRYTSNSNTTDSRILNKFNAYIGHTLDKLSALIWHCGSLLFRYIDLVTEKCGMSGFWIYEYG